MHRHTYPAVLAAAGLLALPAFSGGAGAEGQKAVATLERLGARVERDERAPGKPVVGVVLFGSFVRDDALAPLPQLGQLRSLRLVGTHVSDAGLAALAKLPRLETLQLDGLKITDAGLAHLKGLDNLERLSLAGTAVTDAGLAHLKALPKLQSVNLVNTKVTDQGVADLQKALPKLEVTR